MAKFRINQIHISISKPVFSRSPLWGSVSSSSLALGAMFAIGLALPTPVSAHNKACADSLRNLAPVSYGRTIQPAMTVYGGPPARLEENRRLLKQWTNEALALDHRFNVSTHIFIDLNGQNHFDENISGAMIRLRSAIDSRKTIDFESLLARARGQLSDLEPPIDPFERYGRAIYIHELAHDIFALNIEDYCPHLIGTRELVIERRRAWRLLELVQRELASLPEPTFVIGTQAQVMRRANLV